MKRRILVAALAALALSFSVRQGARAQQAGLRGGDGRTSAPLSAPDDVRIVGGITTLYTLDPLASALCLADGRDGRIFEQNETRNRCSDVDFGSYVAGSFSVGVEGGRRGVIIDLGDAGELMTRYGFRETVGNSQGFASLHVEGDKVQVLKSSRPQEFQELKESAQLFDEGRGTASAPVKVGHIYLLRLTDRNDKSFQRLAKLKVVSYVPGESVTIRWQVL
jgi:hypothetical protein